jgi:hypothetical protein
MEKDCKNCKKYNLSWCSEERPCLYGHPYFEPREANIVIPEIGDEWKHTGRQDSYIFIRVSDEEGIKGIGKKEDIGDNVFYSKVIKGNRKGDYVYTYKNSNNIEILKKVINTKVEFGIDWSKGIDFNAFLDTTIPIMKPDTEISPETRMLFNPSWMEYIRLYPSSISLSYSIDTIKNKEFDLDENPIIIGNVE